LVGLKVPEPSGGSNGNESAAESLKVRVALSMKLAPPASDISSRFWPPGPTSRMSRSFDLAWYRLLMLTVSPVMVPGKAETSMADGYGEAAALSFRMMLDELQTLLL